MMKRKFLAVILPIIGCATVVGSGFSAWYFGSTASAKDNSFIIGTHVTEEINSVVGTLSIPSKDSNATSELNGMNLVLDQGGFGNTNVNQGIMFAEAEDTPNVVSEKKLDYHFNVEFNGNANLNLQDVYDAGMELKVTVSFDLGGELSQYIAVKDDARMVGGVGQTGDEGKFIKGKDNNVYTATYTLKETSLGDIVDKENAVFKFSIDLSTNASFENSLFVYGGVGKKPTTSKALQRMRAVLNGKNITFSTVATIE